MQTQFPMRWLVTILLMCISFTLLLFHLILGYKERMKEIDFKMMELQMSCKPSQEIKKSLW